MARAPLPCVFGQRVARRAMEIGVEALIDGSSLVEAGAPGVPELEAKEPID